MRSIRQVRKRDGRLVEFDEGKIADAIYKAALSVGGEDRFLAEELASVVALFLEKNYQGAIPGIEEVQDMVEKVLIETGHARTAKAYILYRERRAKLREAEERPRPPAQKSLFEPGPVTVLDAVEDRARALDEAALAATIAVEAELPEETAAEVARAVAERVANLVDDLVDAALVSRFVDAELLARGHHAAAGRRGVIGVDRRRIEQSLFPKEAERAGTPLARLAGNLLRQYALASIHPPEVAAAHLGGRIHLCGLENPAGVYAVSVSPDAIRTFGIPGLPGRFRPEAVGSPRRFAAWLGRAVRALAPHVTHGLSLTRTNLLVAPLLDGLDHDAMKEEAWHLLSELAGVPGLEVELSVGPPPILSARKARGADGETRPESYARFAGTAVQMAGALLEMRGTGAGLGQRTELPRLAVVLGPEGLNDDAQGLLGRAVGEALAREPVLFVLDREDLPLLGTSRVRVRLDDATRLTDTAMLGVTIAARAVVNLPRAAYRAGPGDYAAFFSEVEAAAELALEGLRARRRFLGRAAAAPDGPLAPFVHRREGSGSILDLESATTSVAVTGLNEAVLHLTGQELHESDEAVKLGQRALGVVRMLVAAVREAEFPVDVDADEDPAVAERFFRLDREARPRPPERTRAYTPGVALREDAPVDLAMRLETEGRLGMPLRTTTVRCLLPEEEHPAPDTLIALIRKTFANTRVKQVVLGRRS